MSEPGGGGSRDRRPAESDPRDDVAGHLTDGSTWVRLLYMLLFAAAFYLATWVGAAAALLQIAFKLFTGRPLPQLAAFGDGLGAFFRQITLFETFRSEQKPWPFSPWPGPTAQAAARPHARPAGRTRVVRTARRQVQDGDEGPTPGL